MEPGARTVFVIAIATARMIFPGIEPSIQPAGEQATPFGAAVKSVTMELTSSAEADAESTASVTVPKGLGVGSRVNLTIERRRDNSAAAENAEEESAGPAEIRLYWGNHEKVPQGQPRVVGGVGTTEASAATPPADLPPGETDQDEQLPRGTYAHWPGYDDPPLKPHASAAGDYVLTTTWCGGASVTVAEDQDFLDPIRLVSPSAQPDLAKPIRIEWEAVPNAAGYLLRAVGGGGKRVTVWTSSALPDLAPDIERRAISGDELRGLVERKALLPGDATSCAVPAGIFAGANSVMLSITAFGRDTVRHEDGVQTAVIARSTASAALYSKPYDVGFGSETGD